MLADPFSALERLYARGVELEAAPDGRLVVDGPDDVLTDEVVGWLGRHKADLLAALAPPEPEPPPLPAFLPADWTAVGVDPRLLAAIDRSIKAEDLAEVLAFHAATRHVGRKRSSQPPTTTEV